MKNGVGLLCFILYRKLSVKESIKVGKIIASPFSGWRKLARNVKVIAELLVALININDIDIKHSNKIKCGTSELRIVMMLFENDTLQTIRLFIQ